MKWKRYRFKTYAVEDNRPLIFNPGYPWWCSGYGEGEGGDSCTIVAYLPDNVDIFKYWDDAFDIDYTEEKEIEFTSRFPKPEYYEG